MDKVNNENNENIENNENNKNNEANIGIEDSTKTGGDFFQLAEKLVKQQRYQEAMKAYEDAINLGCKNLARALNMRGTFTYLMGDSQNAMADFQKALELKPDYVQIYVKRATIYMEQGRLAYLIIIYMRICVNMIKDKI